MHSFGRKPHHERKGTRDVCVANLLNEDRAKQLPEQGLSKQRSALGEAMRSGVGTSPFSDTLFERYPP